MVENRNSIAKSFIVLSVFLIVLFCLPFLLRLAGAQPAKTGESLVPGDSGVSPVPGVEKLNLIDKGDFYYLNSGEKVSFLRAQKTFAMVYHQKHPRAKELRKSVGKKFKDKIFLAPDRPSNRHFLFSIEEGEGQEELIHQLKRSDNSIRFISPVLTRKNNGRSELTVVPSIIVRIANAFAPDVVLSRLSTKYNLEIASRLAFTDKEYLLDIKEDIVDVGRIFSITRACAEDPGVEWAEPNFLETPQMQFTPNDTLYSNQWHLHNYRDADIDAPEGWDISKGNGAIIAIIDQGVDTSHPDLAIWSNPGETGLDSNNNDKRFNGNDDDNNGYIDDHQGWDFNSQDNDPNPLYPNQAHGTAAAGVAGAIGGNNLGIAGSAIQAIILPIRFWSFIL